LLDRAIGARGEGPRLAIRLVNGLKLNELALYSPHFGDPQRICNEVIAPKLHFRHAGWMAPGYVITSTEPR
jgi:hypothetical protein